MAQRLDENFRCWVEFPILNMPWLYLLIAGLLEIGRAITLFIFNVQEETSWIAMADRIINKRVD